MKRIILYTCVVLGLANFSSSLKAQSPSVSIDAIDAFYDASSSKGFVASRYFLPSAHCQTLTYDDAGNSRVISLDVDAFQSQVDTLLSLFDVKQDPVVIISRYYGNIATAYLSLHTTLIDKSTKDTLHLRSMHSMHLIKQGEWMIANLVIQNEVPSYPFSSDFWPDRLTKGIKLGLQATTQTVSADTVAVYDPNKVYPVGELDVAPEYPGEQTVYETLLESFGVSDRPVEGGSPFTVVIEEDGFARLQYVGDLSGSQIERATSFVNSMLIWYPGVKDAASVKAKLIFYFR